MDAKRNTEFSNSLGNFQTNFDIIYDVFRDGVLQLREMLPEYPGIDGFRALMERRSKILEHNIGALKNAALEQGMKAACRKGCSFCCYQEVGVSASELAFMALLIRESRDLHERTAARLRETAKKAA